MNRIPPARRVRLALAAGTATVLAGGGWAAYAATGSSPGSYRTAVVTVGEVEQTLALSGTVAPGNRADLSFVSDGTVAEVAVEQGDRVRRGQVLARLEQRSLRTAVKQARADLAAARAQLASDKDAQSDTVTTATASSSTGVSGATTGSTGQAPTDSGSSGTPSDGATPTDGATEDPTTPTTPTTSVSAVLAAALAELAAEQDAVTTAQSAATAALAEARTALEAQTAACAGAFQVAAEPTQQPSEQPTDGDPAGTPAGGDSSDIDAACTAALATVQTEQGEAATVQDALQAALTELADTLTAAVGTLQQAEQDQAGSGDTGSDTGAGSGSGSGVTQGSGSSGDSTASPSDSSTSGSTSGSSSGSTSGATATVTAATLARDQASIDEAMAALVVARQELHGATLRAPHAGRVASLTIDDGEQAAAGSTVAVVVGTGVTTVELGVTEDQVRDLDTGQVATVTPAGAESALPATVTRIGATPDTSTGSSTYAATVTLDERGLSTPTGSTASVSVVVGAAEDVLRVPASAVKSGRVEVVDGDGATTTVQVTTGLVGATTVEVTDGLTEGDRVVLADLEAALPSGDTAGTGGLSTGFSGFGTGGTPLQPPMRRG